jgi:hypothetical protein
MMHRSSFTFTNVSSGQLYASDNIEAPGGCDSIIAVNPAREEIKDWLSLYPGLTSNALVIILIPMHQSGQRNAD